MPPTRLKTNADTRILNKKPTTAEKPTVRTKDTGGHRKIRASSCPSTYDTEHKSKATERTSQKMKPSETKSTATVALKEQQKPKARALCKTNSQKAFTVFTPNPRKRQDIQQKAAAELAALEELRLSRAMGYISISSTVGGCSTLEEVRAKQQQEMQIKRRQKQVKKHILQPSPPVQE
ncbi:uncharacterized protein [Misgurnus anguillicaudatus]|uniref:uncharacterized protein n=1 Tax=Misgurnus anguillicaudatus TaxID=75329 RepID=UPI003CCFB1FF